MSILDGMPKSKAEWEQVLKLAEPFVDNIEVHFNMTPQQLANWKRVKENVPLSDFLGITKEEREAALAHGCRLVTQRKTKEARAILFQLLMLSPYDARVAYTTAVSLQIEGNIRAAAKLFVQAIALDATNPEGYIRLGECFLAAKEYENASGSFETAKNLCQRGYGQPEMETYANKMFTYAEERIDARDKNAPN